MIYYEPYVVAFLTFMVTSFGVITNLIVFNTSRKISSMKSSFGVITRNQAVSNIGMSLIYLLFVCPMQLFNMEAVVPYSHFFGLCAMTVNEVSNFSHLLMSVNRFCAVFVPVHYNKMFSLPVTKSLTYIIWLISIALCLTLYEFLSCYFVYDEASWTMIFVATPECSAMTWYSDFTLNLSLVAVTLSLNLLTAFKAGRHSRSMLSATGMTMTKTQRKREVNFIRQSFFQGTTVFVGQITYYVIAPLFTNVIILSFVASMWAFVQSLEGVDGVSVCIGDFHFLSTNHIRTHIRIHSHSCSLPSFSVRNTTRIFLIMNGQQLIGLTLFPLSFIGVICNCLVFSVTLRIRSLSPPFAFLTGCLAFCDAIFNLLYFAFVGPMIVFDISILKRYSNECGYLLMVFYDAAMDIHFVISLNRFFAVFAPFAYRSMFSYKKTKFYGFFCIAFSATNMTIYSKLVNCQMPYDDQIWMFFFDKTDEMCTIYSRIVNMKNISLAALGAVFDVVTILRAHFLRKLQTQSSHVSQSIRRRELDFLKQTVVQGVICLFTVGVYYYVPGFVANIYVVFMMTTFLWGSLSTIDGIAAMVYNSEIRTMVLKSSRVGMNGITSTVDNKSRVV